MKNDGKKYIIGIDEAGMGPVFGPMVVFGVLIEQRDSEILKGAGVKDSKMFGSGIRASLKREEVWEKSVPLIVKHSCRVIGAPEIDRNNMHDLHIEATRGILIDLGWSDVHTVYIEQIGGMKRETCFSRIGFWHKGFVYEAKADVKYPAVSLASIGAKTTRDSHVAKLCNDIGEDFISGYPNKATEDFLRRYYEKNGCLPPGTRISRNWAPLNELRDDPND